MNIVGEIVKQNRPRKPALVSGTEEWSHGQLAERMTAVAEQLAGWEVYQLERIPRVGLLCRNGIDYVIVSMAILKAGGCLVPVAEELTQLERQDVARTTALDGVVVVGDLLWDSEASSAATVIDAELRISAIALDGASPEFSETEFQALNPAFIRFSSGTTGQSKGIVLSHESLLQRIHAVNESLKISRHDRVLWMLPMAHHFAASIILYLYYGAVTVIEDSHFREDVLHSAERAKATVIYGSPFHFSLLSSGHEAFSWSSLRLAIATAAPLPPAVAQQFSARFGKPLHQALGVIEVGLPLVNVVHAQDKPESVGRPAKSFQVEIRDDDGRVLPDGQVGELFLKGPGMVDAYLVPWCQSQELLEDGWFATGDLGERDADGDLFLRGRKKSVINVAGMKVFPEEIEQVLDRHHQVRRSRVSGRNHAQIGMVPVAEIIPVDPADPPFASSLISYCREALSTYKVPVAVTVVESLPMTASGKIKRV